VNAVRAHLRRQEVLPAVAPFLPDDVVTALCGRHVPLALLERMAERCRRAHAEEGLFGAFGFVSLSDTLTTPTHLIGGCERVKNTPLPRQYDYTRGCSSGPTSACCRSSWFGSSTG